MATKPSGLVVLDLDIGHTTQPRHLFGRPFTDGVKALSDVCRRMATEWPVTYTVLTPSGGLHLYFRAPDEGTVGDAPLFRCRGIMDVKAAGGNFGGYVVGPGSVRRGRTYTAIRPDLPVAALPPWLHRCLEYRPPQRPRPNYRQPATRDWIGLCRTVAEAGEGERNSLLYWATCRMRDDGATVDDAIATLLLHYTADSGGEGTIRSAYQ